MTEFGTKVAASMDAHAWAVEVSKSILDDDVLTGMEPYQIEAFCKHQVEKEADKEGILQKKVQMAIYEFGIDRDRVLPVLRISLRDALLNRKASLQGQCSVS